MTIRELREILEEYDGEMEIVISEYGCPNDTFEIEQLIRCNKALGNLP